jgi:hypothetical protein
MNKIFSAAVATTLAGIMMIPAPASAAPMHRGGYGQMDSFVLERCDRGSRVRGCDDWRKNRHKWSQRDYQRWYRSNNFGNVAAGLFGLAIGAAIVNGVNNNARYDRYDYRSHVARCEARYRSYDARTDTFLGYDGKRHRCNL